MEARQRAWLGLIAVALAWPAVALQVDDLPRWVAPSFCRLDAPAGQQSASSAQRAYDDNRPREAAAAFAEVARDATDPIARINALIGGARALKVIACDDEAMRALEEALAVPGDEPLLVGARCRAAGRLARLRLTRRVDDADRRATEVLQCAASQGLDDTAAEARTTQAIAALVIGDCTRADGALRGAVERAASPLVQSEALRTRGQWAEACAHDLAAVRDSYDASVAAARNAGDPEALALALVLRSQVLASNNRDIEPRSPDLETGLAIARAGDLRRVVATALQFEGVRLKRRQTGRSLAGAVRDLSDGAAIYSAIGHVSQERLVRLELGGAQLLIGDYAAARAALAQARALALQSGLEIEAAKALQGLGTIARLDDPADLPTAHRLIQEALDELRLNSGAPDDIGRAMHELAVVETALGDAAAANRLLAEAITFATRANDSVTLASLQANLGWAAWANGDVSQAHAAWRSALEGGSPQAAALAWWGLARMAKQRHSEVALGRYLRAIDQVERLRPEGDVGDAAKGAFDRRYSELYREYAALLMDMGLYAEAHRAALLLQRRELIEHRWLGTRGSEGALLSGGAVAADEPLAACPDEVAEERRVAARARLRDELRTPQRESCCPTNMAANAACTSDEAAQKYCALRRDVAADQKALLRRQEDCIDAIAASPGRPYALQGTFQDQWERAVAATPVHLVVTIVEEQTLYVLARAPGERAYRARRIQVPRKHLQEMADTLSAEWEASARLLKDVRDARDQERELAAREERLRRGVLRELYDLIFGRFDAPPPGATIAFINDRMLRDVPMAALHDGTHYLGERYATVQVTPTSVVAAGSSDAAGKALVMGVSEPDLPHVKEEIAAVAHALKTVGYLDRESTRARLVDWLEHLDGDALALHVASHAWMGGTKASSRIRLWGDETLTGIDLDELRDDLRHVRLVAFSACRSAAAGQGEMSLGLAGLAEKGAPSVLGSLWNVDDDSTGRLMAAFYSNWRSDPRAGVATALALAQRELIRKQAHPFFWAPFAIVGRWD